jgi:hypothetical protein
MVPPVEFDDDIHLPPAAEEARALFGLVERGASTAEAVRKLIAVPPAEEAALRRIAEADAVLGPSILGVLRFRHLVLYEFEELIAVRERKVCQLGGYLHDENTFTRGGCSAEAL